MASQQLGLDFSKILNQSFGLYKKSLGTLYPLSLLAMVLTFAPFLFFEIWSPKIAIQRGIYQEYQLLISFVALAAAFGAMVSLVGQQHALMLGQSQSVVKSLKEAINDYIPTFVVACLYALIVVCGTVLLIIPGIIFAISLMFSLIIRITDKKRILECLVYSHNLIWGSWWPSLIIMSVPLLINFILSALLFIAVIATFSYFPAASDHALTFAFICHTLLQAIFLPFVFATALTLINALKTIYTSQK